MFEWLKTAGGAYNLTLIVAVVAWLISGAGIFAGFHLNKIRAIEAQAKLKKSEAERLEIAERLDQAALKLTHSEQETQRISKKLADITTARTLNADARGKLIESLRTGTKGKIVITFLQVENDAAAYAGEFADVFRSAGFEVAISDRIWVSLAHPGTWLCIPEPVVPPHTYTIERSFRDCGIAMRSFAGNAMHDRLGIPNDTVILVVGCRQ